MSIAFAFGLVAIIAATMITTVIVWIIDGRSFGPVKEDQ